MAEYRLSQQEALTRDWVTGNFLGGSIADLLGRYFPALDAQTDGSHDSQFLDMIDSQFRLLRSSFNGYAYLDSTDDTLEFSVKAFTVMYRGMACAYPGEVNLGPMSAGQTNYIWADFSAAPQISIGVGLQWPGVPHLKLDTFAAPASGQWLEEHRTPWARTQSIQPTTQAPPAIKTAITYADSSPVTLGIGMTGAWAARVYYKPTTAFNGTAPVVTLGDDDDNARYGTIPTGVLQSTSLYVNTPLYQFYQPTTIKAYITPDGATQGGGKVIVEMLRSPIIRLLEYDDASPLWVGDAEAGDWIARAWANVRTGLDGTSPTVYFGDAADPDRLINMALSGGHFSPAAGGLKIRPFFYQYTERNPLKARITPDGSANGLIMLLAERLGDGAAFLPPATLTFASGASGVFGPVPANASSLRVHADVLTPFDGGSPTLKIGTSSNNELLMPAAGNNLKTAVIWQRDVIEDFASETDIYWYLDPDGSAAGQVRLFLEFV